MHPSVWFGLLSFAGLVVSGLAFTLLARLGGWGRAACDWCARAPALDVVVFYFTHGPWVAAGVLWWNSGDRSLGTLGTCFATAVASQLAALIAWCRIHELIHHRAMKGPRISRTLNRRVGMVRNHLAVLVTGLAVPLFTMVRLAELLLYPPIVWLVRFPRYRAGEWISISRQKFDGLVGHDLIWCLYCDWMTGVWSLGSEMLRNVESFWCPIRFLSPEKCANCSVDFPDIDGGWVKHTKAPGGGGGMREVAAVLEEQYPGPSGVNAWFGHPVRLTVKKSDALPPDRT
jgi:hypothetical protein